MEIKQENKNEKISSYALQTTQAIAPCSARESFTSFAIIKTYLQRNTISLHKVLMEDAQVMAFVELVSWTLEIGFGKSCCTCPVTAVPSLLPSIYLLQLFDPSSHKPPIFLRNHC